MNIKFATLALVFSAHAFAQAPSDSKFYRNFSMQVRKTGSFKVPVPGRAPFDFTYSLEFDAPLAPTFENPVVSDLPTIAPQPKGFYRRFWDKILLKDGSKIQVGDEAIPLTCIFISGQDNRYIGEHSSLFPEFLIRVYLVANDYACGGPINPGWPGNGGRREIWDTYIYYEVRDPTIMLPTEAVLHYRRAEYPGFLLDPGQIDHETDSAKGGSKQ